MSYVDSNLMPNEHVVCTARVHWCVFMPGYIMLAFAFLAGVAGGFGQNPAFGIFFMTALVLLLRAHVIRKTTELAVTSKRVIVKTGLVRRHTVELNHSKVESFQVSQGIFGRLMGYGTLTVTGTGGVRTPINSIDAPLEFRRNAVAAVDATQSPAVSAQKAAWPERVVAAKIPPATPLAQGAPAIRNPDAGLSEKLTTLKQALDKGLISQQEYEEKRASLINAL